MSVLEIFWELEQSVRVYVCVCVHMHTCTPKAEYPKVKWRRETTKDSQEQSWDLRLGLLRV